MKISFQETLIHDTPMKPFFTITKKAANHCRSAANSVCLKNFHFYTFSNISHEIFYRY
ncbi:hypothetical protein FD20_GL002063 [Liquorilactobacillus uvarum DSM 19971]|uniref:Uncharacterized protein n=1 Tax=Liquorilactobacillus uvarum DSM 19971 TaxID=1423812 RepID=A0A0R1Q9Q8_9LACO|nr:hypothetical protein FD20_GL002063 [Liquorilactobacillus uvarum DSM 19971]